MLSDILDEADLGSHFLDPILPFSKYAPKSWLKLCPNVVHASVVEPLILKPNSEKKRPWSANGMQGKIGFN